MTDATEPLCGIVTDNTGIPELKQYKDVPAQERAEMSDGIGQKLSDKKNRVVACIGRFSQIERLSNEFLDNMPESVAVKRGRRYYFDNRRINEKVAQVLPWYAVGLSAIAIRCMNWAKQFDQERMTLIIDNLPGDASDSVEFLRRMTLHPEVATELIKVQEEKGVKVRVANMDAFSNGKEMVNDGNAHHGMIIADWVAHSIFAASNNAEELDKPAQRDEEYRREIAKIWGAMHEAELTSLFPIDSIRLK